jgi:predicted AAA+ superfamily ATPase
VGATPAQCHYWKLHTSAEFDLLIVQNGMRRGFEFKLTDSPRASASMHTTLKDLKLDSLHVVHAGSRSYPMGDRLHALALADVLTVANPTSL